MPDDPYQKLLALARETADQLQQRGKEAHEYKGDDGQTVRGWEIETYGRYNETEHFGTRNYRESRGNTHLILTTEGEFYAWSYAYESDNFAGTPREQMTHRLQPVGYRSLAGRSGKPFSGVSAKLERLPWR